MVKEMSNYHTECITTVAVNSRNQSKPFSEFIKNSFLTLPYIA